MIEAQLQKQLSGAGGVLDLRLDFQLGAGEFVALYGRSGAGKTSTLRMLAGLLQPDAGSLRVGGTTWFDGARGINLPPRHRGIGFVFQDYALFPHLSVEDNLRYALRKGQSAAAVAELLEVVELGQLRHLRPAQLSGGQRQRVALARALVPAPSLLLLDEPLAALDTDLRGNLQTYLAEIHRQRGFTALLVSHDPAEIQALASRVLVLEQGTLRDAGPPAVFFAGGEDLALAAEVLAIQREDGRAWLLVRVGGEELRLPLPEEMPQPWRPGMRVCIRLGEGE
ncbi:ABC transporter ATP-binding protein [Neolewinella lacunae]|uniref:ABC transporter ATP-binding protein n=1 Tax=Neolewinella lacunae TaxID=1517758 RepID=A0A923T863_9BACT|nr:ABC transporter ATP-binding protein [Neolewinella lacunae]MBC6993628.1 ABC transporter ATP-binding protein [Neolewinella lacunae]MDN3635534.1 ABC transporter ATP-binding protein [Neolewinella lacunae]